MLYADYRKSNDVSTDISKINALEEERKQLENDVQSKQRLEEIDEEMNRMIQKAKRYLGEKNQAGKNQAGKNQAAKGENLISIKELSSLITEYNNFKNTDLPNAIKKIKKIEEIKDGEPYKISINAWSSTYLPVDGEIKCKIQSIQEKIENFKISMGKKPQ